MGTSVYVSIVLSFAGIGGLAGLTQGVFGLSRQFPANVMLIYGPGAAGLLVLARKYLNSSTFGPANRVTLSRSALTGLLAALIVEDPSRAAAWFAVITASLVLILDGVDGWLARSRSDVSDFGARFDMETDALLILATCILAWHLDKAGAWILAAGLMRYAFVAASSLLPWMRRPLPPRQRRKTIFVVQAISLIVCMAPIIPVPFSDAAAFIGLALLTMSFLIDVAWLLRNRPTSVTCEIGAKQETW